MSSKKITLKTSDNETFEVTEEVALKSQTIKHLIEDECADNVIPLPNVTSETLAKVIEYCKKHVEEGSGDDAKASLKTFDEAFIKAVDMDTLYDLILAANYLHIEGLIDLACRTVAGIIRGKPPEQIRRTFNIVNDFTPEEEKEIYWGKKWAFRN